MNHKGELLKTRGCALIAIIISSCSVMSGSQQLEGIRQKYPEAKPFQNSQFYQVDGVRLHVRQWQADQISGAESKGIIYLVHGLSGSTYNWRFVAPQLARNGWTILTADIPPFGFSGEKQPNSKAFDSLSPDSVSRAKLLWDLFDAVYPNYRGKITIVGHSLGGRVASHMTLGRPSMVGSLVFLAPAVFGTSAVPELAQLWPLDEIASHGAKQVLHNLDVVRTVVEISYGRQVTDDEVFGNMAPFLREGASEACGDWIAKAVDRYSVPLEKITAPTLILWSQGDLVVPNRGKELQGRIDRSVYFELAGKSHCIMDTDDQFVSRRIQEIIETTGPGKRENDDET